ncbi:MAG: cytochrome c oxidase assembly protein [Gammaproteobacteria bacterium]|nr:cytochrome c oxidase assembly protein [Gammaproteobacteria bacterium]MCP5135708.1 cytochrome c oxidase assembly protein [Gammaproteobacteria bacterium]
MSVNTEPKLSTARLVARLGLVVVAMFGFGYVMVPIYDVFCDITGLNGKTSDEVATAPVIVDTSRTVTVEFDATLNEYMQWEFAPEVHKVTVHPGELKTVNYRVRNRMDQDVNGQAVPSVAPGQAAEYLKKTECFCFTQQTLKAGEVRDMPVTFFIDPALPDDVHVVSLSYTFFDLAKLASHP